MIKSDIRDLGSRGGGSVFVSLDRNMDDLTYSRCPFVVNL
jgi:hypothetical protein